MRGKHDSNYYAYPDLPIECNPQGQEFNHIGISSGISDVATLRKLSHQDYRDPKVGLVAWSTRSNSDSHPPDSRSESFERKTPSGKRPKKGHRSRKEKTQNSNESPQNTYSYRLKFKTELCKNFEAVGSCRWGDQCCYAHGSSELRNKTHLNSNYKSKICKHFHGQGACPYGLR